MIMPLIDKAKDDAELINYYRKQYKKQARYSCIEEFGYLPKELCQKFLLKKHKMFLKNILIIILKLKIRQMKRLLRLMTIQHLMIMKRIQNKNIHLV